jgi:hypothetical protein
MSAGDWALVALAVFLVALAAVSVVLSVRLYRLLGSSVEMVDGLRTQILGLMETARTTITSTNRNLAETERLVGSAANITGTVERVMKLVEMALETPLIKAIAASYGSAQAMRRFRGAS